MSLICKKYHYSHDSKKKQKTPTRKCSAVPLRRRYFLRPFGKWVGQQDSIIDLALATVPLLSYSVERDRI